jgi:hypothetical protein
MTRKEPPTGENEELTAVFVSRRVVECDGTLVRRLAVRPVDANRWGDPCEGETLSLLVVSGADGGVDLAVGDRVQFEGLRWCCREAEADTVEAACSDASSRRHHGAALETLPRPIRAAIERLGLAGTFAVVTAETRLIVLGGDDEGDTGPQIQSSRRSE